MVLGAVLGAGERRVGLGDAGLVRAEDGGAARVELGVLLELLLQRGQALVVGALGEEEVHLVEARAVPERALTLWN